MILSFANNVHKTESQNFENPSFSKTFLLVKSTVEKYRPRLNIKEHQLLKPQASLQTYPKPKRFIKHRV